jgi:ribonuclease HII
VTEAGCDEAGRGCLAGPVVAAAVILPDHWEHPLLNDSKKLDEASREEVKSAIFEEVEHFAIGTCTPEEIDRVHILNAPLMAMLGALDELRQRPGLILVDGNRFNVYGQIRHRCIVKGDAIFASIAAASILAKTHRDAIMRKLHADFPDYGWDSNKGYPTRKHREALSRLGPTVHHRKTFTLIPEQLSLI